MKYLGAKTLFNLIFLICMLILLFTWPQLSWKWMENSTAEVLFMIGLFSSLVSSMVYHFWSFSQPSRYRYGMGYNKEIPPGDIELFSVKKLKLVAGAHSDERKIDLPRFIQRLMLLMSFLFLGVLTTNNRGLQLLINFPELLEPSPAQFCQDEEEPKQEDPSKIGCELILKAWEMGYVKDLGTCAPDEEEELQAVCKKREKDEPWLHYSYRRFIDLMEKFELQTQGDFFAREEAKLRMQIDSMAKLVKIKQFELKNEPRAAHHLWTNLPWPQGWFGYLKSALGGGNDCLQEWTRINPVLPLEDDDSSGTAKTFDHSFGHVLFNSTHRESVGYCREYTIHWDSDNTACQQLAEDPEKFLQNEGVWDEVRLVLDRFILSDDLANLKNNLNALIPKDPKKEEERKRLAKIRSMRSKKRKKYKSSRVVAKKSPQSAISFQCLIVNDKSENMVVDKFTIDSQKFEAQTFYYQGNQSQSSVKDRFHAQPLMQLGQLMSPGFEYGSWMSYARPDLDSAGDTIRRRLEQKGPFMLTRLEHLRNADIILQHDWMRQRDDLLEIYPWYLHLHRFVDRFREHYLSQRRRL